tara:strand:- start:285 stop:791 length:507 start_codon:yes stop_codon:yes gene_type:complete
MATFPSIVPSSRLLITGDFPNVLQSSLSGVTTGYRRGNRRVEQVLQLSFAHLTETQVNLIRTHFDGQSGSFENFFLTSSTWNGYATPPVPLANDFAWIYSTPPTITDSIPSRWNVQVELKTVPLERGDLVYDAGDSSATARSTILDALTSSSTPARTNIIDSGDSLLV